MKNIFLSLGLIITLVALSFNPAKATHLLGADMSWIQISKDSYVVTVNIYRDCNGSKLSAGQKITASNKSASKDYNLSLSRAIEITPVCVRQCTRCNNAGCSFEYGFQKYSYTAGLRLDTAFCEYTISYQDTNRGTSITTRGVGQPIYISAYLNRCFGQDNSPLLTNKSLILATQNECVTYNPLAIDTDGYSSGKHDSLSYKLVPAKQFATSNITYSGTYSYIKPLYFDSFPKYNAAWNPPSCAGFHFDSTSGDLQFSPTKIGVAVIAFAVSEWRKDKSGKYVKIGEIERDLALAVIKYSGGNNHAPDLTGIDGTTTPNAYLCMGYTNFFTLNSNDVDPKDTVSFFYDTTNLPKGAHISVEHGKQHPRLFFYWQPDSSYKGPNPFAITIGYKDNACPVPIALQKSYHIYVKPPFTDSFGVSSKCQDAAFKAAVKKGGPASFTWYGDDGVYDSIASFMHYYTKAGRFKYSLTAHSASGCYKYDTGSINITAGPATPAISSNGSDSLMASGKGAKYSWYKDSLPLKDTGNYIYPAHSGTYTVQLIDSNGCPSALSNPFLYTGIKAALNNNKFHIYPNPTTGLLTIEAGGIKEAQLSILNLTGQVQYTTVITEKAELDLHGLAKGIYLLRIQSRNNVEVKQFILQ